MFCVYGGTFEVPCSETVFSKFCSETCLTEERLNVLVKINHVARFKGLRFVKREEKMQCSL